MMMQTRRMKNHDLSHGPFDSCRRATRSWGAVAALLSALTTWGGEVTSFTDDFEGGTLHAFWTRVAQNGSIVFPSTNRVHGGAHSVQFAATGGGQKELSLSHQFSRPLFGTISTWVYDSGDYIYFSVSVANTTVGPAQAAIGVQDWDGSAYYFGLFNGTGGKSGVARSRAWRQCVLQSTASALTLTVDGQVLHRGPGGQPFDKVVLRVGGPGGGTIWFDDFRFEPEPEPTALRVTALSRAGQLTWTNLPALSNGLFSVEWAAEPGTNWQGSWNGLQALVATGTAHTVAVPMVYRVKCLTNLLMPMPVGGRLSYSVSNAAGGAWTEQMTSLGLTRPSAGGGKDYALVENIERNQMKLHLIRSTESAVFRFDPNTLAETLEFQMGPVGTTWTNFNYEGQLTLRVAVEAIETVVVPAGTFPGCYRFRKQGVGGEPTSYWQEWLAPGVGIVKWVDYWVDPSEHPPVTHLLQSISRGGP
jgi:hypothetical protein